MRCFETNNWVSVTGFISPPEGARRHLGGGGTL